MFIATLLFVHQTSAQRQKVEVYKILGISVEGTTAASGTEAAAIIANSGLKVGDELTIPGDQARQAINKIYALRIFSDVQILIENKVGDGVYLLIKVQEYPRLKRLDIHGADEIDEDDIRKKLSVTEGQILTPDDINRIVQKTKSLYDEEGYLQATITPTTIVEDSGQTNKVVLLLTIEEGVKVSIGEITFRGNRAFDEDDLEDEMEDTEEKVWWQFWSRPKFDRNKFQKDKNRIISFYRKHGYLDAEIVSDSIWYSDNKEKVNIRINVNEGVQYKIRSINWEGATVYKPEVLSERLGFKKGDIFDIDRFEKNLRGNEEQTDVASLYLDNGYLSLNIDPDVQRVQCDGDTSSGCVAIVLHVYERNQYRLGNVNIKGNTKTKDFVIRRELYTRPGDFFNRSAIIRSLRQLQQLNYFNPEKLKPDYRITSDTTVDLTYEVEEKSSDNVNASVGYSQAFGVTGALGFTITNFSLEEPLEGGGGQVLNFEWQFGEGARFRTFSLGFTEPWLYNTPTTLGISLYDTRQIYVYDLQQTGVSLRLGRRLKWPDDYFRIDWTFRFQNNVVHDNGGVQFYTIGKTTQYSIAQAISRNSTDSPIFPTTGSSVVFSVEMSGGPLLPGNVDYHKWLFTADWYTRLFNSERLVLYTSSSFGYVAGFGNDAYIPPIEYFYMGGSGLGLVATTPLRGYEDRSIGPKDQFDNEIGGRVMNKQTAEIRLAVTLNPIPIYLLGFMEGGNVFEDFNHSDLFDLKRSYGFGARLLINPIGMVGFDYGYGADDVLPKDGQPDGWRFHFQFGRGF
jgi:outer membrane protein insertion porin family